MVVAGSTVRNSVPVCVVTRYQNRSPANQVGRMPERNTSGVGVVVEKALGTGVIGSRQRARRLGLLLCSRRKRREASRQENRPGKRESQRTSDSSHVILSEKQATQFGDSGRMTEGAYHLGPDDRSSGWDVSMSSSAASRS